MLGSMLLSLFGVHVFDQPPYGKLKVNRIFLGGGSMITFIINYTYLTVGLPKKQYYIHFWFTITIVSIHHYSDT